GWGNWVWAGPSARVSVEEAADDGDGKVWRYRKTPPSAGETFPAAAAAVPTDERPSWLDRDASAEPPPVRPISPALAYDEATAVRAARPGSGGERNKALARGVLVHRLLQSLPDIARLRQSPPDIAGAARAEAARRYLARSAEFSAEERETMVEQIHLLLDDPRFAQLFLPGSRAEVPIVGRLKAGTLAVSGQVDRLAVTGDSVLIADSKPNRPAPRRLADVPEAYVAQLALYRAVLAELYPDKRVRAALVWTDVPDLVEISETNLDAALAAVTSA